MSAVTLFRAGGRRAALLALALGGFGLGLSEFLAMGLLPELARGLLPGTWARSPAAGVAGAGWLITAYALGVVVGAPVLATASVRLPRRRLVLVLLTMLVLGSVASAAAPTFGLELAARFLAGLPHGAYFGVAGVLAAELLGPGTRGRGYAVVLCGLAVANVVGIPLVTGLGQAAGWRVAYLAVAAVFGLAAAAVLVAVPTCTASPDRPRASARAELSALRTPQVWLAAVTVAVGFAGFFAAYSYISPVTTHVTGLASSAVPWVLATAGLGMTVGIATGGPAADRDLRRTLLLGPVAVLAALALFALTAHTAVGLFAGAFLIGGTCTFLGPAMQSRLMQVAPRAQLMGAAVNQSASNLANSIGAALGGLVIGAGLGYLSPIVVALLLGLLGLGLVVLSFRLEDRAGQRAELIRPVADRRAQDPADPADAPVTADVSV